ncbi:hypothetical protein C8R48DRAFT_779470 [Suillus tomentosus]|nr:hypothetical protein C8R48DRAFT_779470 [Suillus tomentosus]
MSVPDSFGLQLAKYTNVAGLTILIYDYFVTLHSEVRQIGHSRIGADLSSRSNGPGDGSEESLGPSSHSHDMDLLLPLSRHGARKIIHPLSVGPRCVLEGAHSSALPYALLLLFEIVLMSTTAFLRYRHYLGSHSALMKSVYRDGLLYMLCITSIEADRLLVPH